MLVGCMIDEEFWCLNMFSTLFPYKIEVTNNTKGDLLEEYLTLIEKNSLLVHKIFNNNIIWWFDY